MIDMCAWLVLSPEEAGTGKEGKPSPDALLARNAERTKVRVPARRSAKGGSALCSILSRCTLGIVILIYCRFAI